MWLAAIVAGACLLVAGMQLPLFTDERAAMQAVARACDAHGPIRDWWVAVDRYRSWHEPLTNGGLSLLFCGVTVAALRLVMQLPADQGWPEFRTPQAAWLFVAVGVGTCTVLTGGAIGSVMLDQQRFHFPVCADSIAIGIGALMLLAMVLTPVLILIGLLVTRFFGRLPAPLLAWDRRRALRSWLVSLLLGMPALSIIVVLVVGSITSAALLSGGYVLTLYLLAATRAALLSPPVTP